MSSMVIACSSPSRHSMQHPVGDDAVGDPALAAVDAKAAVDALRDGLQRPPAYRSLDASGSVVANANADSPLISAGSTSSRTESLAKRQRARVEDALAVVDAGHRR